MSHPFFTHDPLKIPASLPSCCTHVAPDWQEDRAGRLVPVLAEGDENRYRTRAESSSNRKDEMGRVEQKERLQYPTQTLARQPNHNKDEKNNNPSTKANKFEIYNDMPERRSQKHRSSTPFAQHEHQYNFDANNEMRDSKPDTIDFDTKTNEELSDKIQKCTLEDRTSDDKRIDGSQSQNSNAYDVELKALEVMYERLRDTNARVEALGGPSNFKPICQSDVPGAHTWVTRYVDYTSKYGLGFLFNDGR